MSRSTVRRSFAGLAVTGGLTLGASASTDAATFAATTTPDAVNGACTPSLWTLCDAVIAANASAADDSITLRDGTYALTVSGTVGTAENASAPGDLDVAGVGTAGKLSMTGTSAPKTTIDASGLVVGDRVLQVLKSGNLTPGHLKLTGGRTEDDIGGARPLQPGGHRARHGRRRGQHQNRRMLGGGLTATCPR